MKQLNQPQRAMLVNLVRDVFLRCSSEKDFEKKLAARGLRLYYRHGVLQGVILESRKYRLRLLGVKRSFFNEIERYQGLIDRERKSEQMRRERGKESARSLDRGHGI